MDLLEVTKRTKDAVRVWGQKPNASVALDDKLSDFQTNAIEELRVRTNEKFKGEKGFPFTSAQWSALDPKTVRDVRDAADKRVNGTGGGQG